MIIILGLIIVIAAVVIGVAGILSNRGIDHALVHPFAVLGYHVRRTRGCSRSSSALPGKAHPAKERRHAGHALGEAN